MATPPTDPVRAWLKARRAVDAAEAKLAKAKTALDEAEQVALKHFEHTGMQNLKLRGVGTIYLASSLYASAKAGQAEHVQSALRDLGYADMIKPTVHPSTLAALVREMMNDDDDGTKSMQQRLRKVPTSLREHLNIAEKFSVKILAR